MEIVKTPSFELAVYQKGDLEADRLLLCLPGRLDTKDYPHMRSHVEYFAERGYLAASFDPPGTWESPGGTEIYTMTNYLKAIEELIAHYGNKSTVLLGHSRGGSMAMLASSQIAIVTHFITVMSRAAESTPTPEVVAAGIYISKRDTPEQYEEDIKEFRLPLSYFEDCKQYDLAGLMRANQKPKLMMYGTKDVLVTEADVQAGFEAAAEPKEIHELACEHDYRRHPTIITEVNERVEQFLNDHQ